MQPYLAACPCDVSSSHHAPLPPPESAVDTQAAVKLIPTLNPPSRVLSLMLLNDGWWQSEQCFVGLVLLLSCVAGSIARLPYACRSENTPLTAKLLALTALEAVVMWLVLLGLALSFFHPSLQPVTPLLLEAYHSTAAAALAKHAYRLLVAAGIGLVVGADLLLLNPSTVMLLSLPASSTTRLPYAWQGVLDAVHGATVREIWQRFFVHSLLIAGLTRLTASPSLALWLAIALRLADVLRTDVAESRSDGKTTEWGSVLVAVAGNGVEQLLLTLVFSCWGLEAAMVAHWFALMVVNGVLWFVQRDSGGDRLTDE